MKSSFWQIQLAKQDRYKTAFTLPFGHDEWNVMPFGLKNGPSTWSRFILEVLGGLEFVFVYFDDILVFSDNEDSHYDFLDIIFQRLNKYNLTINYEKSTFCSPSVKFLGHDISGNGITPTDERIAYIRDLPKPKTVSAMRKCLGVFSFYRRFVGKAAELLAPLYDELKGRSGKNDRTPIRWTTSLSETFERVKRAFCDYTLLSFVSDNAPLRLTCDASGVAIGGVLEQIIDDEPRPIAFYSEKLKGSQLNWATYDKELYALYASVKHFEHLVQGIDLTLVTDHKPLLTVFTAKARITLERRSRYVEFISQFTTRIEHIAGAKNTVADTISRPEVESITILTTEEIAKAQKDDDEIPWLANNGFEFKKIRYDDHELLCTNREGRELIFVPKILRRRVFDQIHNVAHPGGRATIRLISRAYFWALLRT